MFNFIRSVKARAGVLRKYGPLKKLVNGALPVLMLTIVSLAYGGGSAAVAGPGIKILMIGDSLTAGLGLTRNQTVSVKLRETLASKGFAATVINAGVSGDTSAGGLSRLGWALNDKPDLVIVELGANDGLRGLNPSATYDNLDAILSGIKRSGSQIILTGMKAPPNLGSEYGEDFNQIYPDLAKKHGVALLPFFLEGVASIPHLNQDDAIHPNEKGVAVIVQNLLPLVIEAIKGTKG